MNKKRIIILGGYGRVGIEVARYLLANTAAFITLASRSLRATPVEFEKYDRKRLDSILVDATNDGQAHEAIDGYDLVISCIGPSGLVVDKVAKICKRSAVPLIDAGGYDPVLHSLEHDEIETPSPVPLIISVGLLPGLSGMFPQHVIGQTIKHSSILELDIQYVGRDAWSYNSAWDIINGLGDFGNERGFCYLESNRVVKVPMFKAGRKVVFPEPIGKVSTMLLYAEEISRLARQHRIKTVRVLGANIGPKAMFVCAIAKILQQYKSLASIDRAAKRLVKASEKDMRKLAPAYGIQVDINYESRDKIKAQLVVSDTYKATGVTIGIAARCLLETESCKPGVFMLHEAINDQLFFHYLKASGVIDSMKIESV